MPFDTEINLYSIQLFGAFIMKKIKFVALTIAVSFALASTLASAIPGKVKPPQTAEQIVPAN
jgi:hypothetical protein